MKFEGKGPTGSKLAAWLNKVLVGGLIKLINGAHGIIVTARPGGGVTISTNAPLIQWFYLTSEQPGIDGSGDWMLVRTGRAVNVGHQDQGGSEAFAAPPTSTPEAEIYSTFAKGWFAKGTTVLCTDVTGRWEIINAGVRKIAGTVSEAPGGPSFATVTLAWTGGVNANLIPFGEETEVVAKDNWEIGVSVGDDIGASYYDGVGYFIIDAKNCGG